jgi:hypothetical protein
MTSMATSLLYGYYLPTLIAPNVTTEKTLTIQKSHDHHPNSRHILPKDANTFDLSSTNENTAVAERGSVNEKHH